jgi:hypothetical protein
MPTSLILDPELLQEAIDLNTNTPIETLVETALRAYIDQYKSIKTNTTLSFGESIVAFREKHNISQMEIDPDEIWGDIRDRKLVRSISSM